MNFWIEVSTGDLAWTQKFANECKTKRGLKAPALTRYYNLLKNIKPDDILLSYLTLHDTQTKAWRASIVGISRIKTSYYKEGNLLKCDTSDDLQFPIPIKYSEFQKLKNWSSEFELTIRFRMQKYIIKISENDFRELVSIKGDNYLFLKKTPFGHLL
jgi:hypothetical protein